MDAETMWDLFLKTGLPEAYTLCRFLWEAEEQTAREEHSACPAPRPYIAGRWNHAHYDTGPGPARDQL